MFMFPGLLLLETGRRAGIWCLVSALTLSSVVRAQSDFFDEAWRWIQFTAESGLPSNNVYDVIETQEGTLWAVCDAGIAWYDGFQWNPIRLPARHIFEGKSSPCDYRGDSILVGLENGKLYAVGREGFSAMPLPFQDGFAYLTGDTIFYTREGTLFRLIRDIHMVSEIPDFSPGGSVHDIYRTKGGRIWVRDRRGLHRWENNRWHAIFTHRDLVPGLSLLISENLSGAVFARFELPLELRGLWKYLPGDTKPSRVQGSMEDIQAIAIGPRGTLLAVYHFGEARIWERKAWVSSPQLQSKCRGIHNLFFRRNGDLVVTTNGGIHYFKGSSSLWRVLKAGKPETGAVNEILISRSGETWLGTANGIVTCRKDKNTKITTQINGVPMLTITGLGEDLNGDIWVSSGGSFDGAYRWDGSSWSHFQISENRDGSRFHRIRKDGRGRLWFLGLSKKFELPSVREPGIFIFDGFRFVPWGTENGFPNVKVYDFAEDPDGGYWFATNSGIIKWKNGFLNRLTKEQGLRANRVFTLAVDKSRNVWFGHQLHGGLGCIDSSGNIRYYTASDYLPNDDVWEVRVDSESVLWVATRGGLVSYDDGVWSSFDESSGLQSSLLWPVLPLRNEVYVGTHGAGVVVLNRRESFSYPPRIVIERPNIDVQDVFLSWRAFSFWGAKAPSEMITRYRIDDGHWSDWAKIHEVHMRNVSPGEHSISVQAQGIFGDSPKAVDRASFTVYPPLFLRPIVLYPVAAMSLGLVILGFILIYRKQRYNAEIRMREAKFRAVTELTSSAIFIYDRYRIHFTNSSAEALIGRSTDGVIPISMTELVVPEDRETFLKKCLGTCEDEQSAARCEIRIINSAGDRRWLDFTSGPIRFAGKEMRLGTAFDITERKSAGEKLRTLTSELISTEERERRRVAVYLHDVIGQELALCKIRLRSYQKAVPSVRTEKDIGEILRLIDDSIKNTRSLTFDLSPPVLYELDFPKALKSLAEQLLESYSIRLDFSHDGAQVNIKDEIRVVAYHIVREVIVNCIKHAHASRVKLELRVQSDNLIIKVADDGIGFKSVSGSPSRAPLEGFGLFNIHERLSHLGGSVEISSAEGEGTRTTISIPVKTAASDAG